MWVGVRVRACVCVCACVCVFLCERVDMCVCDQQDEVTTQKQLPELNINHCPPDGGRYNLDGAGKLGGLRAGSSSR